MTTAGHGLKQSATPEDQVERMSDIADTILTFCKKVQARKIFIEDHAYGSQGTSNASKIVELTGYVKGYLWDSWGVVPNPIASASARKTLLQHLPLGELRKRKIPLKKYVVRNVRRLGAFTEFWSEDEIDAFVTANGGYARAGFTAMSFPGTFD